MSGDELGYAERLAQQQSQSMDVFAPRIRLINWDCAVRLETINIQLADFVRAYDRYMIAQGGTDYTECAEASADLDRQYELLDCLGSDRL